MANERTKPYWEELRQYGILQIVGGQELISIANIKNYLSYLRVKGIHYSISENLLEKDFLTKEEYESIRVPRYLMASRTEGENDKISNEIIQVISNHTKK